MFMWSHVSKDVLVPKGADRSWGFQMVWLLDLCAMKDSLWKLGAYFLLHYPF